MTIFDILKQQQDLRDRLYPPALRNFLDMREKMLPPLPIREYIELHEKFKPITSSIESYSNIFKTIEQSVNRDLTLALDNKFSFKEYSLSLFDNSDEIDEEDTGEKIENVVIDETNRIKRIITGIYQDNSLLTKIEPREFEEIIAEMLSMQGFKVELTKQTRDNGFDIIAIKYLDKISPLKFLVECKRYTSQKVGVEIIRGFKDVIMTEKANKGIIVTTSYFSKDATRKMQEIPYLLDFKDKDNVIEWVTDYYQAINNNNGLIGI
jgi:restriction system protein